MVLKEQYFGAHTMVHLYKVYDSLGNLMRKFSTYQAASAYKQAYGNYGWTIKY
jgi:hypothetical protein